MTQIRARRVYPHVLRGRITELRVCGVRDSPGTPEAEFTLTSLDGKMCRLRTTGLMATRALNAAATSEQVEIVVDGSN